jgi:hypothetical protein
MRHPIRTPIAIKLLGGLSLLTMLAGCDAAVHGAQSASDITNKTFNDAADTWGNAFTLHPKGGKQDPQTRYCYQLQSDIVCYDSIQVGSTSKLLGYQDGNKISWVQPGGGSLGASGGPVVAAASGTDNVANAADSTPAFVNPPIDPAAKISTTNLPPAK